MNQDTYNVSSLMVSIGLNTKPAENTLLKFENMLEGSANRIAFMFNERVSSMLGDAFGKLGREGGDALGGKIDKTISGLVVNFKQLDKASSDALKNMKTAALDANAELANSSKQTLGTMRQTMQTLEAEGKLALENAKQAAKQQAETIAQNLINNASTGNTREAVALANKTREIAKTFDAMNLNQIDSSLQNLQKQALLLGVNGQDAADSFKELRSTIVQAGMELEKTVNGQLKNLQLSNSIADKNLEEAGNKFRNQIEKAYEKAGKILETQGVEGTKEALAVMSKGVEESIKNYEKQIERTANSLAQQAKKLQELGVNNDEADRLFGLAQSVREQATQTIQGIRESTAKASEQIEKDMYQAGGKAAKGFGGGFGSALGGAIGGAALGVLGTAVGSIVGEAISNSLMFALNSRMEIIKGTIGGFMSTTVKGMMDYGEEERRLNMATFVTGRKSGFGQDSPEFRKNFEGAQKAITVAGTDYSYSRIETAELVQEMVKAGLDLKDIVGGATREEIKRGILYQGMGLGEAMGLPGNELKEVAILLKQIMTSFPGTSPSTAVRELAALGLSTPAEFRRFKFATQDSLSAASVAGIPLRDVMQGYATMFNMSTPEVAGTLLKNLYNGLNNPNQTNRQLYGTFSKYFDGDLASSLREPGDFNAKLAYLDTVAETIIKRGEASQVAGMGNLNAKYYETLNLQGQANLRSQLVGALMGGGDTFTIGYRNLTLQGREGLQKQKEEFEKFNQKNPDGTGLMEDFVKMRQSGLKGALDLVESSIENITTLFGSKLAPGFTQFVLFMRQAADALTDNVEKFAGSIERMSERIGKAFGNLGDNKLLDQFVDGIIQTAGNLGKMFESWLDRSLNFLETGDNVTNMFENLNNLLADFVGGLEGLFQVLKGLIPLINESGGGLRVLGVDAEVRSEAEALKTRGEIGGTSERVFNYAVETGKIGNLTVRDPKAIQKVSDMEAAELEAAIQANGVNRFVIKTGRERLSKDGWNTGTRAETFKDLEEASQEERLSVIQQGFRKVQGEDGTDYFISGGTGKDQSLVLKLNDNRLEPVNVKEDSDDAKNIGAILAPRGRKPVPTVDPTAAGLGSFLNQKQMETLTTTYKDLESRKKAINYFQDSRTKELFGATATFNEDTARVTDIDKNALTASALMENRERLNALIRTASGKEGSNAAQALAQTAKENKDIKNIQALVNLSTGAVKGTKGETPLLTQQQLVATLARTEKGGDIARTANEYTQFTINELEQAAKQKGKLKPAWDRIKKQLESGEMVGDFTSFLEQFVTKQLEIVNNKNTSETDRLTINENLRAITQESQIDQPKKLDKKSAVAEGVTVDLDKYRKLIDDTHKTRIEQENQIFQLRQKSFELERQTYTLATAYKGQVNNNLESFFGILAQAENTLLSNRTRLQGIDQYFTDNKNNLTTKYKDVNPQIGGGIQENYGGTGQPVFVPKGSPDKEVNALSAEIIKQQVDDINLKNQEKAEIVKQSGLVQENLSLQVKNAIASGIQQATGTLSNLGNTLGASSPAMNQANQMFDAVKTQGLQLAQQMQTLKVVQAMRPGEFTQQDAKALGGLEKIFNSIPKLLKEALQDVVNSMVRELNGFFQNLSENATQRAEEAVGMLGIGGSVTKLLSLASDVSSSIFKNKEEQLGLQQETSGIRRQVGLNQALGQYFPDEFFSQKVAFGEASIRVNEAKIEGLKLDAQNILDMSRIKANLTFFESFLEIFKETRELGRGFSQLADDILDFEKRQEGYDKSVADLELRIKLMTSQLSTVTEVFGELSLVSKDNLEQSKLYLEQQKKALEMLLEIERKYRVEKATDDFNKSVGNNAIGYNQAQSEANNARLEILKMGQSRNSRRAGAELELKNAQIEYERSILSATLNANSRRLEEQKAKEALEQRALSGAFTTPEGQQEAALRYAEIQSKIVGIDTELANTKNAAYNKLKVAMEKSATELDDLYRINSQIADVVDGAFTGLYDILTDSSKTFEQKMKSFSDNLLKELGKIGWNYLKDLMIAPFKDALTKRDDKGIKDAVSPNYSQLKGLEFGKPAMENPENSINREKIFAEIMALDAKQQENLKELNARMRTSILEVAKIEDAGKSAESLFKKFSETLNENVGDGELAKLIAVNSANGEQGMAINIGVQTSIQEKIKNTLLTSRDILSEVRDGINNLSNEIKRLSNDSSKDKDKNKSKAKTENTDNSVAQGRKPETTAMPNGQESTPVCVPVCDGHDKNTPAIPQNTETPTTSLTPAPIKNPDPIKTPASHTVKEQLDMYPENHQWRDMMKQQRQTEYLQMEKDLQNGKYQGSTSSFFKPQEAIVASGISDLGIDLGFSKPNYSLGFGNNLNLQNMSKFSSFKGQPSPLGLKSDFNLGSPLSFGATPQFQMPMNILEPLTQATGASSGGGFFSQLLGGMGGVQGVLGMLMTSLPFITSLFGGNRRPKRYNSGGLVRGFGNSDTIPAMLTPGEGVITNKGMSYIGGEGKLNALNAGSLQLADIQSPQNLGLDDIPSSERFRGKSAMLPEPKSESEKAISEFMGQSEELSLPKIELNYASTAFNGQNFVTEEVFKQAIEQTVETAKNSVYEAIRYSPAARRKLGI